MSALAEKSAQLYRALSDAPVTVDVARVLSSLIEKMVPLESLQETLKRLTPAPATINSSNFLIKVNGRLALKKNIRRADQEAAQRALLEAQAQESQTGEAKQARADQQKIFEEFGENLDALLSTGEYDCLGRTKEELENVLAVVSSSKL